ncbi:YifB family Mg chelatase-like AAA ATPase [Rhodobacteraceae bacterium]|nr:YifB family Mg chelatase-like AAA ATPase [Paracoccaceae bacterium]
MATSSFTMAFQGVDAHPVEVECALAPGLPGFTIVGLPNKAVTEARERVRASFAALSLALPMERITVNLAPSDLPKEGAHYDLPIALALLAAMGVIPPETLQDCVALGALSLDGRLISVPGALPAAVLAASRGARLLCPEACGPEAAWVGDTEVIAAPSLRAMLDHLSGTNPRAPARPGTTCDTPSGPDIADVRGQERAKRALEIAAAGRHHMLMTGPPGCGKSLLAACLPRLLPPLSAQEALETSMVQSVAGLLDQGGISRVRPFRHVHHTASKAALTGGGPNAGPGAISLAHNGVLFLDELPEFAAGVLDTLRQPIEDGVITVARARAHVRYPCRFLLIAAANPCRCGHMAQPELACPRAPQCGADYLGRISGPLLDRFDLRLELSPVSYTDLDLPSGADSAQEVARRVLRARDVQALRFADHPNCRSNADADGPLLTDIAALDDDGRALLQRVSERYGLSARGYHRLLRVARTIADLDGAPQVRRSHLAEAVGFRLVQPMATAS